MDNNIKDKDFEQQIKNGATTIQIFDSWAGLLDEKDLPNYIYIPTLNLVNHVKSLNVPVICFPRGIKNYKKFFKVGTPFKIGHYYGIFIMIFQMKIQQLLCVLKKG